MGKAAKPAARKSRAKAAEAAQDADEDADESKQQEPSSSGLAGDAGAASDAAAAPQAPGSTRKTRGARAPAEDDTLQQQPPRQRRRKAEPPASGGAAELLNPPHQAHPMAREPPLSNADTDVLMEAVIKVFCIHTEPNFSLPWQRKRQYSSSSSGFMMEGRRILTNAHCVDHHTQVKVKRRGSDKKYVASVLAVGTECDIAMLTVEDEEFWTEVEPVQFGSLPKLQDAVTVVGYPIGGDTMSVTSGVVSRIEVTSYVHGAAELLGIQIDAAINSGNSGGPAFNTAGQCVGIAFQSLKHEDAENIAYIIPTPVIEHFINDCDRNGDYTGFPGLGIEWQKLENPDLRRSLKMEPDQKGVMIRRIEPTAPVHKVLSQFDVLLSFDGVDIASDGTVPFRSGERISFSYLVSSKYTNEEAELRVLHDGKVNTVTVRLQAPVRLVPFHIKNRPPSYFIVAGLVFTPITVPYLRSEYGKEFDFDAPVKLLHKMMHGMAETETQQVVVLSQVLASDVNIGYEDILNTQVTSLNGVKVHNMAALVEAVEAALDGGDEFLRLELDYNQLLVLSTAHAREATPAILEMHCIASDRSSDLQTSAAKAAAAATAAAGANGAANGTMDNGVDAGTSAGAAGAGGSRAGGRSSGRQR